MRITFQFTEWGEFHHSLKKHQIKAKKCNKMENKHYGTDNYISDGARSYPVPLLQIFFRKLKLKLPGKCVEERMPRDTKKVKKADEFVLYISKQCVNSKKEEKN